MAKGEIKPAVITNIQNQVEQVASLKKYTCIFFDLDHTLWDYETNSRETLLELYHGYDLISKGVAAFNDFYGEFRKVNTDLWYLYDRGLIDSDVIRKERFKRILEPFQIYEENLSDRISADYLDICPKKGSLMPHALEVLLYLKKHYRLTIITNGFEEIQRQKLSSGNLHSYFDHIVTSQKAGHKKPSREIFECALNLNRVKCSDAIMIGDNLITDIGGARNASIDAVFYNSEALRHTQTLDFEIRSLMELRGIL
jgi:YjjG family noncanonical pyrimidine nucleotidase